MSEQPALVVQVRTPLKRESATRTRTSISLLRTRPLLEALTRGFGQRMRGLRSSRRQRWRQLDRRQHRLEVRYHLAASPNHGLGSTQAALCLRVYGNVQDERHSFKRAANRL